MELIFLDSMSMCYTNLQKKSWPMTIPHVSETPAFLWRVDELLTFDPTYRSPQLIQQTQPMSKIHAAEQHGTAIISSP